MSSSKRQQIISIHILCILLSFGWISLLFNFSTDIDGLRKFESGQKATCKVISIPPFSPPETEENDCCDPVANPLVLNVSVLEEYIFAFPSQKPVCACSESDYFSFVSKYKVGFNYPCQILQLTNYQVFLVDEYTLQWTSIAFCVFIGLNLLWCIFNIIRFIVYYNLKKRRLKFQAPIKNEGDF